jgi:(E)-4-hydroxy-3-methylbut-2-enyl-diphosphate synthase
MKCGYVSKNWKGPGCRNPVIFKKEYDIENAEDFQIAAAADFSPLFIDRSGDGLWLVNKALGTGRIVVDTAFSILQSTRVRTSKTEFISCPSCGRTTFDIQKATAAVKQRTSHLKGLTIAVMGCIVNGPGEMADADYGYVGSGKGRVNLYRKQQVVKKNIPQEEAVDELISLIKESGDWVDG